MAARSIPGTLPAVEHGRGLLALAEGTALTRGARALAEEVGARPIVAEADRLLAAGHTNREIAAWAAAVAADGPEA